MSRIIAMGVLGGLVLAGCANTAFWEGTWVGKRELIPPAGANPAITATLERVELTITRNGTFSMVESGIPKTGVAHLGDRRATLTIERILDRPVSSRGANAERANRDLVLEKQPDGTILYSDPAGFDTRPVRLSRSAQPPAKM